MFTATLAQLAHQMAPSLRSKGRRWRHARPSRADGLYASLPPTAPPPRGCLRVSCFPPFHRGRAGVVRARGAGLGAASWSILASAHQISRFCPYGRHAMPSTRHHAPACASASKQSWTSASGSAALRASPRCRLPRPLASLKPPPVWVLVHGDTPSPKLPILPPPAACPGAAGGVRRTLHRASATCETWVGYALLMLMRPLLRDISAPLAELSYPPLLNSHALFTNVGHCYETHLQIY